MFEYKNQIHKKELKTRYGSVCIQNVIFDPSTIEKELTQLVLKDDNLKHMFAENELTEFKRRNIYKRFIPKDEMKPSALNYVQDQINNNVGFYSFLAEGILGLVFRDIYNFKLAKGVIDVTDTLTDSHTGVDSCMYSVEQSVIVLGEAKFYQDFSSGINKIIKDFKQKNIRNKLESLKSKAENNEESYQIIIKNLNNGEYDEMSLKDFMNQRIIFAGFVLHSEQKTVENYTQKDFYDQFKISSIELKDNISKCLDTSDIKGEFEILLVHLPVFDKKSLIVNMIEKSNELLSSL